MLLSLQTSQRPAAESLTGGQATRRPRVLHLINSFEIGGTERQAVELLKRLDRGRYEVSVAALHARGPFYREIAAQYPNVAEFPLTSFYELNAAVQLTRLRALLVRERFDLLHTHGFYDALLGGAAAQLTRVRVVAEQGHLRLSDRRSHAWGQRVIHRLAHRIIVNSEATREQILKEGSAPALKIVLIRNGLAPDKALDKNLACADLSALRTAARTKLLGELGLPQSVQLVGCVSRLHPVKGHQHLLAAAALVLREVPQAHFVLVGDGPLRSEIEGQIQQLKLGQCVHLLGDRGDAAQLAAGFDVAVLASLHEGLPNTVLEAMAAGTPVVATAVGGVPELIRAGETGYLAPPGDAAGLAERIARALAEGREGSRIGQRGRECALSVCDMGLMVRSFERLYDELLADRQ